MVIIQAFMPQSVESVGHQKAYESKIIVRQFWGIISMFGVSILSKFMFQYRFGRSYDEFIMDNNSFDLLIMLYLIFFFLWAISMLLGNAFRVTKYELAVEDGSESLMDKDLMKVRSAKELTKIKVWYYIEDIFECLTWGVILSALPPVPFYVSYITGTAIAFFATLEGYYHKERYAGLSSVGWSLSIGSGTLLLANVFLNLHWYDNVLSIVSIVASFLVIAGNIAENDVWEKIQTNCPDFSLVEQERVLEGYCYSKSNEVVFHSRNIIGQLMCLLSGGD